MRGYSTPHKYIYGKFMLIIENIFGIIRLYSTKVSEFNGLHKYSDGGEMVF